MSRRHTCVKNGGASREATSRESSIDCSPLAVEVGEPADHAARRCFSFFVREVTADDRGKSRSLAWRALAIRLIILRVMMKMITPIENAASK